MLSSSERPAKRNEKLPHRTFQIPFGPGFMEEMVIRPALERNRYSIGWNVLSIQLVVCEYLLNSSAMWCVSESTPGYSNCGDKRHGTSQLSPFIISHGTHACVICPDARVRFYK